MTIYQKLKNAGKGIKQAAIGGLAALAIALSSGCAPQAMQKDSMPMPAEAIPIREAQEISPIRTYFGPRIGAIWALNEKNAGTDYTGGSKTLGVEFGVEGRRGLELNLGLDFYDSEARNTENGTDYSVENDSILTTIGLVQNFGNRANPARPYLGLVVSDLHENTRMTVGDPYNEDETMSNNMWGYGVTGGVRMDSQGWGFRLNATWTQWPDSDNVRGTVQATASLYKSF